MQNAQELIEQLLSSPEMRKSRTLSSKIYEDEPIFKTGTQMLEEKRAENTLPPILQELRDLQRSPEARRESRAWLFVQQARIAEDYEDDYDGFSGTFHHYFPTYQDMVNSQLRGYFAWRTRIRHEEVVKGPTSFAFVLIYELLNGIGSSSADDGFSKLMEFWDSYGPIDPKINRHMGTWMRDYVVFHGLDRNLLDKVTRKESSVAAVRRSMRKHILSPGPTLWDSAEVSMAKGEGEQPLSTEDALANVLDHEALRPRGEVSPIDGDLEIQQEREHVLVRSLGTLANIDIRQFVAFSAAPETTMIAIWRTWDMFAAHCDKRRKTSLVEDEFGVASRWPYQMFSSAVFHNDRSHPDTVYEAGRLTRFICRDGNWTCEGYRMAQDRAPELKAVLKRLDALMCEKLGVTSPWASEPEMARFLERIIEGAVHFSASEMESRTRRQVRVDLSLLQGIRDDARQTCESLLIDEERNAWETGAADEPQTSADPERPDSSEEGVSQTVVAPVAPPDASCEEALEPLPGSAGQESFGLDTVESAYLRSLLAGEPAKARAEILAECGRYESIVIDSINEALFDEIGDIVVEQDDGGARLVEDYTKDLEGMFLQWSR